MRTTIIAAIALAAGLCAAGCQKRNQDWEGGDPGVENTEVIGAPGGSGSASGVDSTHLGGDVGRGTGYGTTIRQDPGTGAPAEMPRKQP
jgi:hypothetical protein